MAMQITQGAGGGARTDQQSFPPIQAHTHTRRRSFSHSLTHALACSLIQRDALTLIPFLSVDQCSSSSAFVSHSPHSCRVVHFKYREKFLARETGNSEAPLKFQPPRMLFASRRLKEYRARRVIGYRDMSSVKDEAPPPLRSIIEGSDVQLIF